MNAQDRFATVDGARTHYLFSDGGGLPVVTLHGVGTPAGLRADARKRSVARLASYRLSVYSLDLPGFGQSALPTSIRATEDFAPFVIRFTDAVRLSEFFLVGTSFGGAVACLVASLFPNRAKKLVLVGAAGLRAEAVPERSNAEPARTGTVSLADRERAVRHVFYDQTAADAYLKEGVLNDSEEDLTQFAKVLTIMARPLPDLRGNLRSITCRTLLLWGKEDHIIPLSSAYEFQRLIPNSKIHVIENCGHLPQIEKPDETHEIIADFLLNS